MRILVAQPGPSFSVQDVYAGWVEALRALGQQVVGFNLDDRLNFYSEALLPTPTPDVFRRALDSEQATSLAVNGLYAALYKVRPDVLLVISGFFVDPEVYLRARDAGTRVVLVHTEEPYEHDRDLARAQFADLNLLNDPTNLDAFNAVAPSMYIPHLYRPLIHHPGPDEAELACDLAFVGTGYPSRVAFLEAMDLDGLDVLLAGHWTNLTEASPLRAMVGHDLNDCMDNDRAAAIYRSARCGLNLYRRETTSAGSADGWAMGPREVEMAACGLFFVREPRGEGDEVLPMLPTFTNPREASDLIRWWLAHPDERAEVAAKARAAIADRTFTNAAAEVLRLLDYA
jgi:spore maturation protein CgeB